MRRSSPVTETLNPRPRRFFVGPTLLAGALALTCSLSAVAHAEQKLAYVDLQRALLEVDEGKAAKSKLKGDFDGKQKQLDAEQEDLKKEKEDLDKRSMAMSDDARRTKEQELQSKLMVVTNHWQAMQKDLSEKERVLTQGIFKKMSGIIGEIAQSEGITFVFDKNAGLVYAPPSLDVTDELIRRYNLKYPVGATAKKSPKKAKTSN